MARISKNAAATDGTAIRRNPEMFLVGGCLPVPSFLTTPPPASSAPGVLRRLRSVRRGTQRHDLEAGEDLLVHDEHERQEIQGGHRRDGAPDLPLLADRALVGDPAAHGRQPENDQGDADGHDLVETLVEHRVAVTLRPVERTEAVE